MWRRVISLDVGSANVRIWQNGVGLVYNQPACIAIDNATNKIIAIGDEAALLAGRTGSKIKIVWPWRAGTIYHLDSASSYLRIALNSLKEKWTSIKPLVIVASVPTQAVDVDRQAFDHLLKQLGAQEVLLVSQVLAAAIGADVKVADVSSSVFFHLGAQIGELAVISYGSVSLIETTNLAGDVFDQVIVQAVKEHFELDIDILVAKKIKHQIVNVISQATPDMSVVGQHIGTQSPQEVKISGAVVSQALQPYLLKEVESVTRFLEQAPSQVAADLIDKGLLLSGGLAKMGGFDRFLVQHLGIAVGQVEEPDLCVIKGLDVISDNLEDYRKILW